MSASSNGGLKVLDAVARAFTSRLEDFESACRSGSGSRGEPPAVENVVGDLAHLFEDLARRELEAIRAQYFAPDGAPNPNRTMDYSPPPPGAETPDNKPDKTVDFTPAPGVNSLADRPAATGDYTPSGAVSTDFVVDPTFEAKAQRMPSIPGYEITGVLGRGGMGIVYKARQAGLNRDVALKMILKGEHASASAVVRFLTEARAIAQLNHPNIVQVYEINENEDLPYFSLEFCPGGSLDKALKKEPQDPRRAAELTETLARGLAVAHKAGVLHRDIKPANVLLDANGTPKITDFGLARLVGDDSGLTANTSVLGSPSYMPPEQAAGTMDRVGPASDQYSLGASLYEFITGRPPFHGSTQIETLKQVREKEPVAPSVLQPTCPKDLETICLKALSKEMEKRYPSVEAFADDLKAYLEGRPISARPVGTVERAWRWAKRNPKVAALSAGLVGLAATLLVGATVAALVFRDKNSQLTQAFDDLKTEKKQSDENYAFARENGTIILNEVPRLLQKQVLSRGVEADFAKIIDRIVVGAGGVRALPDRMLLFARLTRGNAILTAGDDKAAETEYRAALELAKSLADAEPKEKDKAAGHVALCVEALAQLQKNRYYAAVRQKNPAAAGFFSAANGQFDDAVSRQRERLAKPLSDELPEVERKQTLASSLLQEALLFLPDPDLGGRGVPLTPENIERAKQLLEEARGLQKAATEAEPTEATKFRAWPLLGDIEYQLYRANRSLRKQDDARKYLESSIASSERAVKDEPTPIARLNYARRLRLLGDWHVFNGDRTAATPWDQKAYEQMRSVVVVPEVQGVLNELSSDHYRLGADNLKVDAAVSSSHFRASLRLREALQAYGDATPGMQLKVMASAGRCGQTQRVAKMANGLAALKGADRDPSLQRQIALSYGICAGAVGTGDEAAMSPETREKLRKEYTEKAVSHLANAARLLRDAKAPAIAVEQLRDTLRSDPDLDGVRGSEEFKKLVADLTPSN
ncbi:MAG: protein kinase [Gemmataceae bacterium]|nr:protein kinase [Gemmataceae bacterium]